MPEPRTIRIGLLCLGTHLPYWQAQAIRHVLELSSVQLVVLGIPGADRELPVRRGFKGYLDHRLKQLLCTTSSQLVDMSDPLAMLPSVELERTDDLAGVIGALGSYSPDLIFSFLPLIEQGASAVDGSCPIWQFRFNGRGSGLEGMPIMDAHFVADDNLPVQLLNSTDGTYVDALFPLRDENDHPSVDPWLLGAAWLPAKVIGDLRRDAPIEREPIIQKQVASGSEGSSTLALMRTWLGLELRRLTYPKERDLGIGSWNVGVLHQPITALLEEDPSMNVRWLPSPSAGNHRMEPFGYTASDGQLNVLYRKRSAMVEEDSIAKLRPKSDSVLKRSRTMLATSASLTYPFIVERPDGAYAIIGYAHQHRTELFKVTHANDGLDQVKVLLDRALVNPTLTQFEGRWWLFGTDPDAPNHVLLAYFSETFDGPFVPHGCNPLKIDPQGTRPAGTFFTKDGTLWRPAKDVSEVDVEAVVLNRVLVLTPDDFEEEAGKRIDGFRGSVYGNGLRTLSAMGDITLIDGIRNGATEQTKKPSKREKRHRSERS